jgi:hypothetical protein
MTTQGARIDPAAFANRSLAPARARTACPGLMRLGLFLTGKRY